MTHDGNQQQIPTEGEIAWLAGVIECDGTVMLSCYIRDEKASKPKVGVEIKLYNTDGGIIAKAVDIITQLNLSHYMAERTQKPMDMMNGKSYGNDKTMLSVSVKNLGDAYLLGKIIRPWMFGEKALRLDLVVQYLARRLSKIEDNGGNFRNVYLDRGDCELIVDFYRRFVKRPGHNRHLVEALLND